MSIIRVTNLKKSFAVKEKGKTKIVEAVNGVTLNIEKGEIFGFLGPNGAGKTTTQRMLATLLPIDSGEAEIAGFDVKKKPKEVRQHIGYVGQLGGADLNATGMENLVLQGQLYGMKRSDIDKNAKELIELLDLGEFIDRIVRKISGGQKRRLEIALGLIHKPEVLFLDEPTTGLDPQNRANLWKHIKNLKAAGMTIFLTTHYLDEADNLADRLAIMDLGHIVAEGTPAELKKQISGDVIRIKLSDIGLIEETAKLFKKSLVKEIKTEDDVLYLTVTDGTAALPKVFEMLKSKNITADTISVAQPSLDDVFLKQTGRTLRD